MGQAGTPPAPTAVPLGLPAFFELAAPRHWRAIDFISDLHLAPSLPRTFEAWANHLRHTRADAVFILGDLFELWVGDDARSLPFEHHCVEVLADACSRRNLAFMVGNRDFLLGAAMLKDCGIMGLPDPTVLSAWDQRVLLTHGDALCLADTEYQAFRREVRSPAWQQAFLSKPLAERQRIAGEIRQRSDARRRFDGDTAADVDTCTAVRWMHTMGTAEMVHGHTHRPGSATLAPGFKRHVLSDWDLDGPDPRAEVLRLSRDGFERLPPREPNGRVERRPTTLRTRAPMWQRWKAAWTTRREAAAVARRPIPDDLWKRTLVRYPFLRRRDPTDAALLRRLTSLFLDRKEFSAQGGQRLTNDVVVAIAAQACLPVLKLGLARYDGFLGIVVHPDQVVARREVSDEDGVVHEYHEVLTGEAMEGGPVMLSWRDVRGAGHSAAVGYNVVIHEFAHVLDMADGVPDGVPLLPPDLPLREWQATLEDEYQRFVALVDAEAETTLDPYGAQSPDEFFAVASEAFFTLPTRTKGEHPALYAMFARFYRQDPAAELA